MSEKDIKFAKVKKIILAPLEGLNYLRTKNIICVSAVGKPYGDYAKQLNDYYTIEGIQTDYPMFLYGVRVKDYQIAHRLYTEKLNKIGLAEYVETLDDLSAEKGTDTIAFIGTGYAGGFCYRFILADYFKDCGAEVLEYFEGYNKPFTPLSEERLQQQRDRWNKDLYRSRGHFNLTDDYVGTTLESMNWIFAKTMADNPHNYALRKNWSSEEDYLGIVKHIRNFGEWHEFKGFYYRCWDWGGYRYWTMPQDLKDEDCDLINRRKL